MEPLERIPRQSPPLPPPSESTLSKLFTHLVDLKNNCLSCFGLLKNQGNYVNLPDSELDQRIQKYTHDTSAIPKKSAFKSSNKIRHKQEFKEDLTSMRTYSKDINKAMQGEKLHKRREDEESSNVKSLVKRDEETISPLSPGENLEARIQRYSHNIQSDAELETTFFDAKEGAYLINKSQDAFILIVKKNNRLEMHPFKQLEDEQGTPLNTIESKSQTYEGYEKFVENSGAIKDQIIRPNRRLETLAKETFLHELSLEKGIEFLRDKSDRSFIIIKSDKIGYSRVLLIKKESLIPFVKPKFDAVYFNIIKDSKGKSCISTDHSKFENFNLFLFANETGKNKGLIDLTKT